MTNNHNVHADYILSNHHHYYQSLTNTNEIDLSQTPNNKRKRRNDVEQVSASKKRKISTQQQGQKAPKNKDKKPKQQKSNACKINKLNKSTLFTDIYAKEWKKFEIFAEDMPKVSSKSIKKYLNKAPNANAKLSKDMKSLLAASYMVVYFSEYHNSILLPINIRYYASIFFIDFTVHPFCNERGSYGLVKDDEKDDDGGLILSQEWKELFQVWIGWSKNNIHKRIKKRVDLQMKSNEEVNKSETSENIGDIVDKNVGENIKQKDVDDEIESGYKEANIGDIDLGIKQMCNDLGIVLDEKAKKALATEKVSYGELKECHVDGSLKEYMEEPLFLNAIQRKRIMKYMATKS